MNTFEQLSKLSELPKEQHQWILLGLHGAAFDVLGHLGKVWVERDGYLERRSKCTREQAKLEKDALAFLTQTSTLKLYCLTP